MTRCDCRCPVDQIFLSFFLYSFSRIHFTLSTILAWGKGFCFDANVYLCRSYNMKGCFVPHNGWQKFVLVEKKSVHLLPSWYDGNHPGWPGLLQAKCTNAPINNIFVCFALFKMHSIFNIFWNSALPTLPGNRYDWVNSLNSFDEHALDNNSNSVPLMCQTTKRVQSNLNSNWVWLNVWFPIMQINVLIIHL